ncbi:MAG: pilus assembly protein [Actinomycetota bacterium]|nr:pilus assembly protein [Actinomycetota bacterium]
MLRTAWRRPGEPRRLRSADARTEGSAVVDFVFVSVLVVALFLLVAQVGVALHVRNVLVASAAEGARYGANADRGGSDGERRARAAVASALSTEAAARMSYRSSLRAGPDGEQLMEITISGPLPVVFLPAGPLHITVQAHALKEGP